MPNTSPLESRRRGELLCVGTGMTLGAHLTPLARNAIETADLVFIAVSNGIVEKWIEGLNARCHSLQPHYALGKSRHQTYREMVAAMLDPVRAGERVCGAFYGHPGVFAFVPHEAIRQARSEGYPAVMVPGISAEDCLYADLGIDPGRWGCQHYEASQFMFYRRQIDPSAYLILWQIGFAGDRSLTRFETGPEQLQLLTDMLLASYACQHHVLVYQASCLPTESPLVHEFPLGDLPGAPLSQESTLVIPHPEV